MAEDFVTWPVDQLILNKALPGPIYLCIDHRFVLVRPKDDLFDDVLFDRFQFKKVSQIFVRLKDRDVFEKWQKDIAAAEPAAPESKDKAWVRMRDDLHRKALDIFLDQHPDKLVTNSLSASKKLVSSVMKTPFAIRALNELQTYSRGTVDHSVNVSVLATYLGMQMGYTHSMILTHLSLGGLLHDVGKVRIPIGMTDSPEDIEAKLRRHPIEGALLVESLSKIPGEVKMIIEQHHECYDGSGFPKGLRRNEIYDLARVVSIANAFDELVGEGTGALAERQKNAIQVLYKDRYREFDPQKLDKALKILKLGI